jgi:hypothetical protein
MESMLPCAVWEGVGLEDVLVVMMDFVKGLRVSD